MAWKSWLICATKFEIVMAKEGTINHKREKLDDLMVGEWVIVKRHTAFVFPKMQACSPGPYQNFANNAEHNLSGAFYANFDARSAQQSN